MNFIKKLSILLLFFAVVCSCQQRVTDIVIISTNDIHAQISRFPQLAAFIKQKRTENDEVVLVDAGDRFSGNPYVDHASEKGAPIIRLMNKLGYEAACMGNHDFDYGQKILKQRISEAQFPVLCANMESPKSELGSLPPYQIIEKCGLKFCFFSLIQTGSNHMPATNPANLENISFRYYKDVAQEYKMLDTLCDVFIGLTHLGFAQDSLLALVMPELDVIVGGHSHTVIHTPKVINGVLVTQTGSNLNYVGITTLRFKGKKLLNKSYSLVSLKDFGASDQEISLIVEEINNHPEFKEILGTASVPLKTKEDIASLMTDAMADIAGTDFAFYNKGGVRLNTFPEGAITREKIYKLEPFSNYIVKHEWSLEKMKEFILKNFNRTKEPENRYINFYISAGKYEILRNKQGDGVDVKFYDKQGRLLKDTRAKYKIAFSNYVTSSNAYARGGEKTDIYITDAIIQYLAKQKAVSYQTQRAFIK